MLLEASFSSLLLQLSFLYCPFFNSYKIASLGVGHHLSGMPGMPAPFPDPTNCIHVAGPASVMLAAITLVSFFASACANNEFVKSRADANKIAGFAARYKDLVFSRRFFLLSSGAHECAGRLVGDRV
jgi:hypothetical protein